MNNLLKYKGYHGSAELDQDDGILHGEVLFINSIITYEAESVKELQQAFQDSVDAYLESCQEKGISPEKPFSGTFNIRLGSKLHKDSALCAKQLGISINEFVINAVSHEIERLSE